MSHISLHLPKPLSQRAEHSWVPTPSLPCEQIIHLNLGSFVCVRVHVFVWRVLILCCMTTRNVAPVGKQSREGSSKTGEQRQFPWTQLCYNLCQADKPDSQFFVSASGGGGAAAAYAAQLASSVICLPPPPPTHREASS